MASSPPTDLAAIAASDHDCPAVDNPAPLVEVLPKPAARDFHEPWRLDTTAEPWPSTRRQVLAPVCDAKNNNGKLSLLGPGLEPSRAEPFPLTQATWSAYAAVG